jgi:hypothetical protein
MRFLKLQSFNALSHTLVLVHVGRRICGRWTTYKMLDNEQFVPRFSYMYVLVMVIGGISLMFFANPVIKPAAVTEAAKNK